MKGRAASGWPKCSKCAARVARRQTFFVIGDFLAAGLFQAATKHLGAVVCGGQERVELERVLAVHG